MAEPTKKPRRRRQPKKAEESETEPVSTRNKSKGVSTKYVSDKKKKARVSVEKFDVPTNMLKTIADLAVFVDDDVTIKFSNDGVYATNRDIVNIIAMWANMNAPGYTYDGDEVSVCVNVDKLIQAVKGSDKDDTSIVSIRDGSMFINTHGVVKRLPVFVDGREAPPNTDEIIDMIPNSIRVSTGFIKRFMSVAKDEEGGLHLSMYDGTFHMSIVDEMTDQDNVMLDVPEDKVRNVEIIGDSKVQLDVDLTFKMFGAIASMSKSVDITAGTSMPIYVSTSLDNGYDINYIMAPRVVNTDDE